MINKFYAEVKKYIKENYKFLICLILIIVVFNIDTGYSIYKPGGTINTSERVTGLYEHEGSFNMAYVGFMEGKLPFYLIGKLIPQWELVENKKIKADNETMDDSLTRDHLDYNNAISNAKIIAYKYANIPYKVVKDNYYVYYLAEDYNGSLNVGDKIISYDGINFERFDEFKNYIKIKDIDDEVLIVYERDGKLYDSTSKVYEEDGEKYLGISIINEEEVTSDTKLTIKTKDSEAGPSGGLIMALSMYNSLVKDDITKGKKIVGTGTIDAEGNVGKIGSVTYKLASAEKAKADLFICPNSNLKEASEYAKEKNLKIEIKGVSTFEEALKFLNEWGN